VLLLLGQRSAAAALAARSLMLCVSAVHTSKTRSSPGAMRCVCSAPLSLNHRVAGGLMRIDKGPVLFRFVTCTVADVTPLTQAKSSTAGVTASGGAMAPVTQSSPTYQPEA
jgi:hypothetical protein